MIRAGATKYFASHGTNQVRCAVMPNGEKGDPHQRSSTDESLRSERRKTDLELASRSEAVCAVATDVVSEARQKADLVPSEARDLEDRKSPEQSVQRVEDRNHTRAQED